MQSDGDSSFLGFVEKNIKAFIFAILLGAVVGLLVSAVYCYLSPKRYESVTSWEVKSISPSAKITSEVLAAELASVKSQAALEQVETELELAARWAISPTEAVKTIEEMSRVELIENSNVFKLTVAHTNQTDARDVCREIFQVYAKQKIAEFEKMRISTPENADFYLANPSPVILLEEAAIPQKTTIDVPKVILNGSVIGTLLCVIPMLLISVLKHRRSSTIELEI